MQGATCTFVIPHFVTEFDGIYHYLWWIFAVFPYLETLKDLIRSSAKVYQMSRIYGNEPHYYYSG